MTRLRFSAAAAFVLVAAAGCVPPPSPTPPKPEIWPTNGWSYSTPEAEGVDSRVLASAVEALRNSRYPVHSLFVERNGRVVLDADFFPFTRGETHDLASVTKSVISTLAGIAERDGKLGSPGVPLSVLLPAESARAADPRKAAITLGQFLSMTSGLDCSAAPGENLLREMEEATDWVAFMLNRPLAANPVAHFQYCGGSMHIVSAALTRGLGENAFAFARDALFAPLGIVHVVWPQDPQGNSHGFADLELSPEDAAKLGYLWLHGGVWDGQQIVPGTYLSSALSPHAQVQIGIAYGYGFWLYSAHWPYDFEANGRGGQRITVVPSQNLVVVTTAGGGDANVVSRLVAPAIKSESPLPPDPAGDAALAAAVSAAAQPPAAGSCAPVPIWARGISGERFVISDNPLRIHTLELRVGGACDVLLGLGFSDGSFALHPVGMDGVPRLSPDPESGHGIALSAAWTTAGIALDYNLVARIDDYGLFVGPVPGGLHIHLMERTGPVDMNFVGSPG